MSRERTRDGQRPTNVIADDAPERHALEVGLDGAETVQRRLLFGAGFVGVGQAQELVKLLLERLQELGHGRDAMLAVVQHCGRMTR